MFSHSFILSEYLSTSLYFRHSPGIQRKERCGPSSHRADGVLEGLATFLERGQIASISVLGVIWF